MSQIAKIVDGDDSAQYSLGKWDLGHNKPMNLHFLQHIPEWLVSTATKVSLIAAWVGLIVTVRREMLERVRLNFKFQTTFVEEDDVHTDVRLCWLSLKWRSDVLR